MREVLASEMLEALSVNTCKTFSLFETGEQLFRGDEPSPARSSVLVRLSHSHIRFGTFERLAFSRKSDKIKKLLDYVLENYYPHLINRNDPNSDTVQTLFREIVGNTAETCASWMVAGFVHGVLNTDNMNITGESFDYGPWRFLPKYDPDFVAAYFDETGLYAYGRQPAAVLWNLRQLALTLQDVTPITGLEKTLESFQTVLAETVVKKVLWRLGLKPTQLEQDEIFVDQLFSWMEQSRVGFDQFFFDWHCGEASSHRALGGPAKSLYETESFAVLRRTLSNYEPVASHRLSQLSALSGPIHMLIDEVERVWAAINHNDQWDVFEQKVNEVRHWGRLLNS